MMNPLKYEILGLAICFHFAPLVCLTKWRSGLAGPRRLVAWLWIVYPKRWSSVPPKRPLCQQKTRPDNDSRKRQETNRSYHACRICGQVQFLFQTTNKTTKYFFPQKSSHLWPSNRPTMSKRPPWDLVLRNETSGFISTCRKSWEEILPDLGMIISFSSKQKQNKEWHRNHLGEWFLYNKHHWVYKCIYIYDTSTTVLSTPSML